MIHSRSPATPIDMLAVIVPAHNEARLIARCLTSVLIAADRLASTVANPPCVRLVVVLDACTDGTAEVAAATTGADEAADRCGAGPSIDVQIIQVNERRVGSARRAGAQAVLAAAGDRDCWLASTDADTTVPAHWLTGMVGLARAGADLVLGTVEPGRGLPPGVLRRWRAEYHSTDGHPHVHGANLGISDTAYRLLGGWSAAASDEDVLLVRRAEAAGLTIMRTGALAVRTSSRRIGRAPRGFAAHLAGLTDRSGVALG